jgi:hypothetical protein
MAHTAAKLQHPDSTTENIRQLVDLALNFIIYMAFKLHEQKSNLTSAVFLNFLETHPAYQNGQGLIFQRSSSFAKPFLATTYKYAVSVAPSAHYLSGNMLRYYIGSRRTFEKVQTHSLYKELLKELGLGALLRELSRERLSGPLDSLHADFIESGPFKFKMSEHIQDHLTFQLDGHVVLYNPTKFDYLVMYRNCIAEYSLIVYFNIGATVFMNSVLNSGKRIYYSLPEIHPR